MVSVFLEGAVTDGGDLAPTDCEMGHLYSVLGLYLQWFRKSEFGDCSWLVTFKTACPVFQKFP